MNETWTSPQTIVALLLLVILAGTVGAVFVYHDPQTVSQTVGGVLGIGGTVAGYYFSSTLSSRKKDETINILAASSAPVEKP